MSTEFPSKIGTRHPAVDRPLVQDSQRHDLAALPPADAQKSEKSPASSQAMEEAREVTSEQVERAVEDLNQATQVAKKHLSFQFHEDVNRMVVRVIDLQTQEVIREVPPEKVLDAAVKIREMIGLLLDERV